MDIRLLDAVHRGSYLDVRSLLEHGADVHVCADDGRTPLHYAVSANRPDIALVLLRAGANPRAKSMDGLTPLDLSRNLSR